jgi:hypothetical protein
MEEHNNLIVWKDETKRMQIIYNSMNDEQRAANAPWPYSGKYDGVDYEGGQIPPPPPPASASEVQEIDQDFRNWRSKNNRDVSMPLLADYIDYYGAKMEYYIDGKRIKAEDAKSLSFKQGCLSYEITTIDDSKVIKITTIQ